jgi:hypothetical protein
MMRDDEMITKHEQTQENVPNMVRRNKTNTSSRRMRDSDVMASTRGLVDQETGPPSFRERLHPKRASVFTYIKNPKLMAGLGERKLPLEVIDSHAVVQSIPEQSVPTIAFSRNGRRAARKTLHTQRNPESHYKCEEPSTLASSSALPQQGLSVMVKDDVSVDVEVQDSWEVNTPTGIDSQISPGLEKPELLRQN